MKNIIAAAVVCSLIAPAFAAEFERAPELPDLSEFVRSAHELPAPAAAPAKAVGAAAKAACAVPNLNGALIGRGVFSMTYDVKIGDKVIGTISSEGDGYALKDADGNAIAKTSAKSTSWGSKSEVTDCSGAKIGGIQEEYSDSGSNFTVSDAAGNPYANTGWTDSSSVSLKTASGATAGAVTSASSFFDKFTISAGSSDARVVAFVGVMNTAAAYKRSAARRRDRMIDGPHGRADRN